MNVKDILVTFGLIILPYDINVSGQQFNDLGIFG